MRIFYNNVFKNYFLLTVTLFIQEIIFRLLIGYTIFDWAILRIFIGINILSLFLSTLFSFFGRLASNILSFVSALFFTIYAIVQVGFLNYLGVFMSFGTSTQAGAVKDYVMDYLASFEWNYWLIGIPLIVLLLFYVFVDYRIKVLERNDTIDFADKFDSDERKQINDKKFAKMRKNRVVNAKINGFVIVLIMAVIYYFTLVTSFMQNDLQLKTNKELFNNPDMPNIAMGQFGFSMYAFVDVKSVMLPTNNSETTDFDEEYEKVEQIISDYTRYIDDSLWETITKEEKNANYKKLNNYYISQKITDKNELTGFFKNKNLIVIMMESTNNMLIMFINYIVKDGLGIMLIVLVILVQLEIMK